MYNVKRLGVFGSYVHDSQTDSSDIDILVEFDKPIGWEIVDLKLYLEEILRKNVDLVTIRSLRPELREIILRDVVYT
jgi:predicted nucleotidyltransferase